MDRLGFIHEKLDIKILILFILRRLPDTVDADTLAELALCDDGISYFDYAECLAELVDTGHIDDTGNHYRITEKGDLNGGTIESSLPYSVRTRCDENLVALNDALRREKQIRAEVTPSQDGTCQLALHFEDDGGPLMELSALMPTPQAAAAAAARFRREPDVFYHEIITLLCAPEETDPGERK